jgi:hypothetical protein
MKLTATRARRTVARARLTFEDHVEDPRNPRGRRHPHRGLLSLAVAALAAGKRTLREAEDLSHDLPLKARRAFGLRTTVSDTAMYELFRAQSPEGLRAVLQDQVRADLRSKAVTNDRFPGGVLSIDGKGAGSGKGPPPHPECRTTVGDAEGTAYWHLFTLRAALTSSSAAPVLDQEFLDDHTGEPTAFPVIFERASGAFPRLFRFVTADAGNTSAANARLVLERSKVYVFGLKANLRRLYGIASDALADAPVVAETIERYRGGTCRRELRRVGCPAGVAFPGATQFWAVRRIQEGGGKPDVEERLFVTAVPFDELSPDEILALVRLHWGIENNANWTMDMLFEEDQRSPCSKGNGILVISWLRLLAYNIVSVVRARARLRDRRLIPWRRAYELVYQALLIDPAEGGRVVPIR